MICRARSGGVVSALASRARSVLRTSAASPRVLAVSSGERPRPFDPPLSARSETAFGLDAREERHGRAAGVRRAPTHRRTMYEHFGAASGGRRRRFRVAAVASTGGLRAERPTAVLGLQVESVDEANVWRDRARALDALVAADDTRGAHSGRKSVARLSPSLKVRHDSTW